MKKIFIAVLLLAGLLLLPAAAKADLTITPWRVVFEGRTRSATVELLNMTDRTNTYRIGWLVPKRNEKTGKIDLTPYVDDKDPHSVAKMVVFSPRQVTIEPRGHQIIRLSLRRPADLPPGEYRAHLSMIRLAKEKPQKQDPKAKDIEMVLNVNLGFSIPVIVRSGEDKDLKISLSSPGLSMSTGNKPSPVLDVDINRDAGKFSSYGSVNVYWAPDQGKEEKIGTMDNIALYPEVQSRHLSIRLKQNPTDGKIRVVYLGKYESAGKTWAEKTFPIGK
ncbi:MAG: hypothetical protein V1721_02285 [Pseudomonadota bacterium]